MGKHEHEEIIMNDIQPSNDSNVFIILPFTRIYQNSMIGMSSVNWHFTSKMMQTVSNTESHEERHNKMTLLETAHNIRSPRNSRDHKGEESKLSKWRRVKGEEPLIFQNGDRYETKNLLAIHGPIKKDNE